jgi:DNA polymerase-1
LYLTPTKNHWILDIETDGLRDSCSQIFVVCVENAVTDEAHSFRTKEEFNAWQDKTHIYVGHNLIGFDLPVLNRHWGAGIAASRAVDTFVLSMLYSPTFQGGHSLEAWGLRVDLPKLPFKDFSQYSEEMLEYCRNDVAITKRVFNRLSGRMRSVGFTEMGAEIETLSWHLIQNKQRRHGFPFDYERAHKLFVHLRTREEELKREIYKHWPPQLLCVGEYRKAFKKDGSHNAQYERHVEQYPRTEILDGGGYKVFDWVEFNLGSPKQRIEKLLDAGWVPTTFTKRTDKGGGGNPKVDEESLNVFAEKSGNTAVTALAKWVITNSRANMINTWLNAYNPTTGAIHGNLWIASTLRYRHDNPNSANIPAVRLDEQENILRGEDGGWSYESRDLWTSGGSDYALVGVDAKGIQLRVLAHYVPDEEFRKDVLVGDRHKVNMGVLGLPSKPAAKKFLYATLLGAGGEKLAVDQKQYFSVNLSTREANALKNKLIDSIGGFRELIAKLQLELKKTGRIKLCDGTPILVPSDHMVIAYLLQGDESRIMKLAAIYLDAEIRRQKLEAWKVGDIHDEWQFVVAKTCLDEFISAALGVFPRAGDAFGYRVPIEGDAKVGLTWAETH